MDRDTDQLANSFTIEYSEWIVLENIVLYVNGQEFSRIISTEAERRLSKVIRAEGKELRLLRDFTSYDARAWKLDHGSDHVINTDILCRENLACNPMHDCLLVLELFL